MELKHASLSVRDNGPGVPGDGSGNGLKGLRERAIEAGAHLTIAKAETGGFVLTVARSGQ